MQSQCLSISFPQKVVLHQYYIRFFNDAFEQHEVNKLVGLFQAMFITENELTVVFCCMYT